jgi:hypothetical protein
MAIRAEPGSLVRSRGRERSHRKNRKGRGIRNITKRAGQQSRKAERAKGKQSAGRPRQRKRKRLGAPTGRESSPLYNAAPDRWPSAGDGCDPPMRKRIHVPSVTITTVRSRRARGEVQPLPHPQHRTGAATRCGNLRREVAETNLEFTAHRIQPRSLKGGTVGGASPRRRRFA